MLQDKNDSSYSFGGLTLSDEPWQRSGEGEGGALAGKNEVGMDMRVNATRRSREVADVQYGPHILHGVAGRSELRVLLCGWRARLGCDLRRVKNPR